MTNIDEERDFIPVTQPWVHRLPLMQQGVLVAAIRGPDGIRKQHISKLLMRWYRRCILMCAFDHQSFDRPYDLMVRRGGSFTGPSLGPPSDVYLDAVLVRNPLSEEPILPVPTHPSPELPYAKAILDLWEANWSSWMHQIVTEYMRACDELPHHFQLHLMHAAEILGYQHPDPQIRQWWHECYLRLVNDLHLNPETEEELNRRLSDSEYEWKLKEEAPAN